jgi:hypothetical protein
MGASVDGWEAIAEFPMKAGARVLWTVANPKAGPESGEDASPRKTTDFTYLGPHKPSTSGRAGVGHGRDRQFLS